MTAARDDKPTSGQPLPVAGLVQSGIPVYLPRRTWQQIQRIICRSDDPTPSAVRLRDAIESALETGAGSRSTEIE